MSKLGGEAMGFGFGFVFQEWFRFSYGEGDEISRWNLNIHLFKFKSNDIIVYIDSTMFISLHSWWLFPESDILNGI